MKSLQGRIVAALCFCVFLASTGYGKPLRAVYLKDGGIIDCKSFWKEDGKVMVLVNRDVLVDLPRHEVDMKRTFMARKRAVARKTGPAVPAAVPAGQVKSGKISPSPVAGSPQKETSAPTQAAAPSGTKGAAPGTKGGQ